ncbi:Bcr/CflA family drug resistance efflux transporter [Shewanella algicola]|uniref:Bcr/CflA family efflux transporter n=1 Tax=Shewanella algicola TaxID=640633 RepID=A0A9X1ZA35_9GAMM|nr:multidrug effflux MFS transporter [Shewanella algicola]MCL1104570.1 multidrug effflux MFS transporter [Shewanella algicola]GGP44415.1 Bcr/CflA family drug resistance efflux transporter [Shewanella algicola]
MNVKQPVLGPSGTLFFLVIVSAFPPLTTDLYLPALPTMVEMLNTTQTMVNLTLSVYFVTYALGLLFWGPLSEKFGRKPIMLLGLGIYVVASMLCAMANNVEMLISARLVQAFGGSAVTVVATAIVKDLYDGREREKIMATIMSLVIIAPMVAPVLGAFLLKIGSWHMMFIALAIFGALSTVLACGFRETIEQRYTGSVLRSWGRLAVVSNNPRFISLLLIFTLPPMTLMSFLAAGSYIYIDGFGLSEQTFSYAFAFNAFFASFGPTIYIKLSNRVKVSNIISVCYLILMFIGVLTYNIGHLSPWLFACLAAPATLMVIVTRVPGINLMLEQQTSDTGSAVAVIQFCSMMAGAIGMTLVTLHPDNLIHSLAIIQFSIGALASIMWYLAKNKAYVVDHLTTP